MEIFLHGSDIGNPCTPMDIYLNWAYLVTEEFNYQTIKENKAGLSITAFMKYKDEKTFIDSQISFCSIPSNNERKPGPPLLAKHHLLLPGFN